MAYSDYCICEVCGRKAFYDSDLYENIQFGEYDDDGNKPEYAGLCVECAKTHRLVAVVKEVSDGAE